MIPDSIPIGQWVDQPCNKRGLVIYQKIPTILINFCRKKLLETNEQLIESQELLSDTRKQLSETQRELKETREKMNQKKYFYAK
jgi:hypothetical protein